MDFSSLLAPMSVAEFSGSYWNRQSVLLPRRPGRYDDLSFDFAEVRRNLTPDSETDVKAQFLDASGEHLEMAIQPSQIDLCFAAGMTICIGNVGVCSPRLAARAQALRSSIDFCGNVSFGCYWSPENGGFGLHYDAHPVFILQLTGKKRWMYSDAPAVSEPIDNFVHTPEGLVKMQADGHEIAPPDESALRTAVLEPGDLLFLPAGAWHKTTAVGGESRALTLRLTAGSSTQTVVRLLEDMMITDGAWRRPLPLADGPGKSDELRGATASLLGERLNALKSFVAQLTVTDLARSWAQLQSWREDEAGAAIGPADRLFVRNNVRLLQSTDAKGRDRLFVYDGRAELALEVSQGSWLAKLLAAPSFDLAQAQALGAPSLEEAKSSLAELVELGVLGVTSGATR